MTLLCQIMSKFGDWYETYDEVPGKLRSQITRSMFPPGAAQAAEFGLERWYVHSALSHCPSVCRSGEK